MWSDCAIIASSAIPLDLLAWKFEILFCALFAGSAASILEHENRQKAFVYATAEESTYRVVHTSCWPTVQRRARLPKCTPDSVKAAVVRQWFAFLFDALTVSLASLKVGRHPESIRINREHRRCVRCSSRVSGFFPLSRPRFRSLCICVQDVPEDSRFLWTKMFLVTSRTKSMEFPNCERSQFRDRSERCK